MIPWLRPDAPFPPVERALNEPNGLLCASVELTAERLREAYAQGIFPWYCDDEPILWWSPDPRMVLHTDELRISRSLGKRLRQLAKPSAPLTLTLDRAFAQVIRACSGPRPGQDGTWITPRMQAAYIELHQLDLAHSIEVWQAGQLVGGLYGVALGRMFFGESMFTRVTDGSKLALVALVRLLAAEDVRLIDCQQDTAHLASLGARPIARAAFGAHLSRATAEAPINWDAYRERTRLNDLFDGVLDGLSGGSARACASSLTGDFSASVAIECGRAGAQGVDSGDGRAEKTAESGHGCRHQ